MNNKTVSVRILRYSPEESESKMAAYEIPYSDGLTIQVLLRYIYEHLDPTLAFRDFRCGRAVCNTCRVKLNGKVVRSCETIISPGQDIYIEPAGKKVVKDLVVDYD